jgi:glutamine amidotransferase
MVKGVTVLDYGVGNLHSLAKALEASGASVTIEANAARAADASCLIMPGVGAFPVAARQLEPVRELLRRRLADGLPCLAICLGMQLLMPQSDEGEGFGLGLVPGRVTGVRAPRIPHMGWNDLSDCTEPLLERSGLHTPYFANSFACRVEDQTSATAWVVHGDDRFPAALRIARTVGVQFHPEKSSRAGLAFIREFWREVSA